MAITLTAEEIGYLEQLAENGVRGINTPRALRPSAVVAIGESIKLRTCSSIDHRYDAYPTIVLTPAIDQR